MTNTPAPLLSALPGQGPTHEFSASELTGLLLAGVLPRQVRRLVGEFSSRTHWLASPSPDWEDPAWRDITPIDPGMPALVWGSSEYPWVLDSLVAPPPVLYVEGDLGALVPGVGVIGSRAMTSLGRTIAQLTIDVAGQLGANVVSGLATGVDEAAHRAMLETGLSVGLGVAGAALDSVSARAGELAADLVNNGGAVISELPPGTASSANALMARNRLIAAFSFPLVVAEASLTSGSTACAGQAIMLGRPVVACIPRPNFRDLDTARGLLALAGVTNRAALNWPTAVFEIIKDQTTPANAVCATSEELCEAVKIFHVLGPRVRSELRR